MRSPIAIAMLLALSITACRFEIGPGARMSVASFGTHYLHIERDAATGEVTWHTDTFRSWGTSKLEIEVSLDGEKIGIVGDGISSNMANLVTVLGDKGLCAVPAIAPSCIADGFGSGGRVFQGSDRDRADAIAGMSSEELLIALKALE